MKRCNSIRGWARELGMSPQTFRRAIAEGELMAYRPGTRWIVISDDAIDIWLKSKRVAPRTAAEATHIERRLAEIRAAERARP